MRDKNSFGKMPYEHIPDELPDSVKLAVKKLPPGELLRRIKGRREKPETKEEEEQK
jgi:hypothetical protein